MKGLGGPQPLSIWKGLGAPNLVHLEAGSNRERLGGAPTHLQIVKGWGPPTLVDLDAV